MLELSFMWLIAAAFIFVIFFVPLTDKGTIGQQAIGAIVKGSRVGAKSTSRNGVEIDQNPQELADSAGLDLDTYAGARGISSEEGNSPTAHQIGVAWVFLNNARYYSSTIFEYATDGSFGKQTGGVTSRPISTFEDPYEGHVAIMKGVLSGQIPDPTNGARFFVAARTQDILHNKYPDQYKSFDEVDSSRIASGLKRVDVEGVDPSLLVFYA